VPINGNSPVGFAGGPPPGPLGSCFMRAGQPGQNPYVPGSCTTSPHVGWFNLGGEGFDASEYAATGAINVYLMADPNVPLLQPYAINQTPQPKLLYGSGVGGYMFPTMTFDIVFQRNNTGPLQLARLTALKVYYIMWFNSPPDTTVANLVVFPVGGLTLQAGSVSANMGPIPGADIQARPWSNASGAARRFASGARGGTKGLAQGAIRPRPGLNPGAVALLQHYRRTFS
jgi:hypothetical protein